jgi:hypothetical protein
MTMNCVGGRGGACDVAHDDDLNLYAYTYNDPANKTDPTGNCPACLKLVVDFGLELAIQYATTGEIDIADAAIETATGAFDPTKTLRKVEKLARIAYFTEAGPLMHAKAVQCFTHAGPVLM